MNQPFVKEALKCFRDNRNGTTIDRGMMSDEAECIPRSTIYIIENRVGDHAFTIHNCFKEIEVLLDSGINNCFNILLLIMTG